MRDLDVNLERKKADLSLVSKTEDQPYVVNRF